MKLAVPQPYDIVIMINDGGWVSFRKTGQTVVAPNEEEAIKLAKKLGFDKPVLERVHESKVPV